MLDYILIKTGINTLLARRDEEGASAVEYGLLVAGIAALIVAIVFIFGGMISSVFSDTCTSITTHDASGSTADCA
jgi:pilus assembly protein Flp/PilA